jgi:hypothetical protein
MSALKFEKIQVIDFGKLPDGAGFHNFGRLGTEGPEVLAEDYQFLSSISKDLIRVGNFGVYDSHSYQRFHPADKVLWGRMIQPVDPRHRNADRRLTVGELSVLEKLIRSLPSISTVATLQLQLPGTQVPAAIARLNDLGIIRNSPIAVTRYGVCRYFEELSG